MNKLRLKNTEKKPIFCHFLAFLMLISLRDPKILFVKGKNMYILAIATHLYNFSGVIMQHEQIRTYKY